jgi:hypothetical protein
MNLIEAMAAMLDGKEMTRTRRFRRDVHFRNPGPGATFLRRDITGVVAPFIPDDEDAAATDWREHVPDPPAHDVYTPPGRPAARSARRS